MKKHTLLFFAALLALPLSAVELELFIHTLGGNVRGFGLLAEYSGAGGTLRLTRRTRPEADRKPDYGGFPGIASVRVFDPEGRLVNFTDLGNQKEREKTYTVTLPPGKPGVWRVSVANGLSGDRYTLDFPDTPVWGIRGEMALGLGKGFPEIMYLYIPENAKLLIAERFGGGKADLSLSLADKEIGSFENRGNRRLSVTPAPVGETVQVKLAGLAGRAIAFDGVPGLLAPTPEAARTLQGGIAHSAGFTVSGPYQARVRAAATAIRPEEFRVEYPLPAMSLDFANPQLEALPLGKYGFLGGFNAAARAQELDPASPFYGANPPPEIRKRENNWQEFLSYTGAGAIFSTAALASAATTPGELNLLRGNRGVINRAAAAAFYHFAAMSGDDIIREGDFRSGNYPHIHAFFSYNALAQGFEYLRDDLAPEHRELWREGLLRAGDKAASFMGYQSNQWSHMITAFLSVYLATGEQRFRDYFEIHLNAYLDNDFGPGSKFGQHPAGFYLEECGPDGNYDHLNGYSVAVVYYKYRALPDADPKLVEKLRKGIQKNLVFKSFHWLRQPGGAIRVPNAPNCRTDAQLGSPSYPADYLARPDFDLGYTRFMMNRMPAEGIGMAATFSHVANTDEWAKRLIAAKWPRGTADWQADGFPGAWTREIYDIYRLPIRAKLAPLPCEAEKGYWELPGLAAWKSGGLYGLLFYDVTGSDPKQTLPGITSGGPLTLWDAKSGSTLGSMRNARKNRAASPDDITWCAVYGTVKGRFAASGKEHSRLTTQEAGKRFSVAGALREGKGTLAWEYEIAPGKLLLTVRLNGCDWENPVLNLPFLSKNGNALELKGNELTIGRLRVKLPEGCNVTLAEELPTSQKECPVRPLRLPFPADRTLRLEFCLAD